MRATSTHLFHLLGAFSVVVALAVFILRPTEEPVPAAPGDPESAALAWRTSSSAPEPAAPPEAVASGKSELDEHRIEARLAREADEDPGDRLLDLNEAPPRDFPDTPMGRSLSRHMLRIEGIGPDAQARYQESLEELREEPEEASELLLDAYLRMDSQRYLDRWKIVDTLATLESHETLPALAQVAEQPVQEETLQHDHQFSQQAEEQMIRTSAIQGLEQLARRGVVEAEAEILELTASTDPIVRETAVLAYRRSGPGERAERIAVLEERLPEEHHPLLRIQEVSAVELVPQPEPGSEAPAPTGEGEAGETNAPGEPPAGTSSEAPSEDGGSPPPRAD